MAEFCLDCWNKLNGTDDTEERYVFEWELCEECGEYKPVIIGERGVISKLLYRLRCKKK